MTLTSLNDVFARCEATKQSDAVVPRVAKGSGLLRAACSERSAAARNDVRSFSDVRSAPTSRTEKTAVLCRECDILRKTGHKIFNRYKDCGLDGLTDRNC